MLRTDFKSSRASTQTKALFFRLFNDQYMQSPRKTCCCCCCLKTLIRGEEPKLSGSGSQTGSGEPPERFHLLLLLGHSHPAGLWLIHKSSLLTEVWTRNKGRYPDLIQMFFMSSLQRIKTDSWPKRSHVVQDFLTYTDFF